jgi:sugar phosphate permease
MFSTVAQAPGLTTGARMIENRLHPSMQPTPQLSTIRPTRIRHVVLWLTVAAYMITYMDRVVMSNAAPTIRQEFGFDLKTWGWIMASFQLGYSLFQIPGGWLGDRVGPRRALTWIVTWWSLFTSLTAAGWNAASMIVIRFLFGVGEAGAFPIATRSLSRWMLPSERGFAQGVTHAGSRLGGAITPWIVVAITLAWGWRAAFIAFGFLGMAWAAVWFWYYRDTPDEHKSVNAGERELIHQSLGGARPRTNRSVPWRRILSHPTLWILSLMYFCYAYCISLYLYWYPTYLNDHRGFDLKAMGFYAMLPLLAGTGGDFLGGVWTDWWARRTGNLTAARRGVAVSGFLIAVAATVPATFAQDPVQSVWLTCIAVFALELTVGVSWAVPLDIGGDYAGSVSAVMNTCGNIGGTISTSTAAYLVAFRGWEAPFLMSCLMSAMAAALFLKIDATRRIFAGERVEAR